MKNKIVTRMLACLMASAILATTVAGGVVLQPVTVMAEETGGVQSSKVVGYTPEEVIGE